MRCRTFKVPATAPGENLKSRRNMMAITLHARLKAHGVTKLGARLSIINSLASPTLDELEAQLFKEAPPPSAEEPSSSIPFARFVVVHPSIHIRELPDTTSAKIGTLFAGDEVVVLREDGKWLELAEKNNRRETNGWVLRDGSSLGLGVLLRPLPPPPQARSGAQHVGHHPTPPLRVQRLALRRSRARPVARAHPLARTHGCMG